MRPDGLGVWIMMIITKNNISIFLPEAIRFRNLYDIPINDAGLTEILKHRLIGSEYRYKIFQLYRQAKYPSNLLEEYSGVLDNVELLHSILPGADEADNIAGQTTSVSLYKAICKFYNLDY